MSVPPQGGLRGLLPPDGRAFAGILLAACALLTCTAVSSAQLSTTGRWLGPVGWGDSTSSANPRQNAVHMALLRGKSDSTFVLWWASGASAQLYAWDPADYALPGYLKFNHIHVPDTLTQIFCAGQHTLADGRLLVAGGMDGPKLSDLGTDHADIFDPVTKRWTAARPMNVGRYYPTLTMLGNGNLVATAGNIYYHMCVFGGRGGSSRAPVGTVAPLALDRTLRFDPGANDDDAARYRHSAVYDAGRQRTVVFGGKAPDGTTLGDVRVVTRDGLDTGEHWRINLISALPDPVAGYPAPRSGHSAVVLPSGDTMYVYGGQSADGSALSDTWRLILWENPVRWERVYPLGTGPGPRFGHAAVYDPGPPDVESTYPLQALEANAFFLNHAKEHRILEPSPNLVGPNKRMLLFGGLSDNATFTDRTAWALSLSGPLRWVQVADTLSGPTPRAWICGAYDKIQRSVEVYSNVVHERRSFFFGGNSPGGLQNDLWALIRGDDDRGDTTYRWQNFAFPSPPPPRFGYSMVADDEWDRLVIFGGDTSLVTEGRGTNDLWSAQFTGYTGWNHQPTINTPGPLSGHTADYHFLSVIAITPEMYNPASNRWTMMNTSIQMQNYPAMHLLPSGNLFFATRWNADESPSPMLNMRTGQWGYTPWVSHFPLGTSVEYAPGKILKVAGNTSSGGTAIDSSAYIEFGPNDSTTGWVACSSAPGQRVLSRNQHNLTVLPNGQVLVTGGEGVNNDPALARRAAQIWDPKTHLWTPPLAAEPMARTYHSTAVLLPDGRVLSAGGSTWPDLNTATIYEPPYLFKGNGLAPVPRVDSVKTTVAYGEHFPIFTDNWRIVGPRSNVCLIRPASTTHGFNEEQQYIPLKTRFCSSGVILADAPADSNIAPPGNYMLFVVDSAGVPARARWVSVGLTPSRNPAALPCDDVTGIAPAPGHAGLRFEMGPNRPNPFTSHTRIAYTLPSRELVSVRIYDVSGQLVRRLEEGPKTPGAHSVEWDRRSSNGSLAPAGVYFCRLSAGPYLGERKLIILR